MRWLLGRRPIVVGILLFAIGSLSITLGVSAMAQWRHAQARAQSSGWLKQLAITPAVAGRATKTNTEAESTGGTSGADLPMKILGNWTSEMRETKHGPMTFNFRFRNDGTIEVTGTPVYAAGGELFQRSGTYQMDGHQLVSPALNEGQPVRIWLQNGKLDLQIDESLEFRLVREWSVVLGWRAKAPPNQSLKLTGPALRRTEV
jgi:hypothetical protein